MKLGVVTTSYPREPGDPAGNFVAAHVRALRALGHTVEVIAAGRAVPRGPSRPVDRRDADVTWIPSALFDQGGAPDLLERAPVRALAPALAFSARLTAVVTARAPRWDAVIAHWLVPSALAALPSRTPLLAIAHGGDVHTLARLRLLRPALHLLHLRDAELVFVSDELRAHARAAVPELATYLAGARVQPMGIDLARFGAIRRAPTTPTTVLVAARLVPIKGVDVAIAALAHLRTPARLVVAGDGPERARLEALAASAGDRVSFVGMVATTEIDRLLETASVVVVPSRTTEGGRTEGTPLIALEALAAGVPVVASAVGGLRALAPPATLVRPEDPQELAAAIDAALGDPPAPEALHAAVSHLDWAAVGSRLLPRPRK